MYAGKRKLNEFEFTAAVVVFNLSYSCTDKGIESLISMSAKERGFFVLHINTCVCEKEKRTGAGAHLDFLLLIGSPCPHAQHLLERGDLLLSTLDLTIGPPLNPKLPAHPFDNGSRHAPSLPRFFHWQVKVSLCGDVSSQHDKRSIGYRIHIT